MKYTLTFLLLCVSLSTSAGEQSYPETLDDDSRQVRSWSSPAWLEAVGRMTSRLSTSKGEQCSLSVVSDHPSKAGIIVVGAAHCVDHWANSDGSFTPGSHSITWTSGDGVKVVRTIAKILHAEMNPGDYFIGKLNAYIPASVIKPLLNAPYDYSDLLDEDMFGVEGGGQVDPFATMAGFSADTGLGQKGKVMTYDERCKLNGGASGMKKGFCHSYEGASGGPVVVTVAVGDMSDYDWQIGVRSYFVGSIVGARGGDTHSKTLFTESTHYTKKLDSILSAH